MADEKLELEEEQTEEQVEEEGSGKGWFSRFIDWCKAHPKTVFVTRVLLWCAFSAVLPFVFIAWRYGIFSKHSSMKLSGWGIIAVIILIVFAMTLIKYVYKGLKPGFFKQCVGGAVKIILPLTILLLLITSVQNSISYFKQALGCVIICEAIGIPLNPFPAWLEKRRIEKQLSEAETMSDIMWGKFFEQKKKEEEGKE